MTVIITDREHQFYGKKCHIGRNSMKLLDEGGAATCFDQTTGRQSCAKNNQFVTEETFDKCLQLLTDKFIFGWPK